MSRRRILSERLQLSRDALWAACKDALSTTRTGRAKVDVQVLEQRVLYSASPLAVAAELLAEPISETEPQSAPAADSSEAVEEVSQQEKILVFVDSAVGDEAPFLDRDNLASDGQEVEFYVLSAEEDGILAISEILESHDQVAAIHIVSHGEQGQIRLGNATLDSQSVAGYAGTLALWGQALTDNADILIYGCDVAETASGQLLLGSLSELTTADVAGSTDTTGHTALGGDWDLEYHVGAIEAGSVYSEQFQSEWFGTLDARLLFSTRPGNGSYDNGVVNATPDGAELGKDPSFTSVDFFDINPFTASSDPDVDAIHYVSRDVTAAGIDLEAGDILLSVADSESLTFTIVTPTTTLGSALFVNDSDLLLFRPHTPGDYTSGSFTKLLTDPIGQDLSAISLVEKRTTVAEVTLEAGTFLLAGKDDFNLYHFTPSTNAIETLINGDGSDPQMDFGAFVDGIALISSDIDLGGISTSEGQLLITLAGQAKIGVDDFNTKDEDAFVLDLTATSIGSSTAEGSVEWLLDSSKVGVNGSQSINGLTVVASTITGTVYEDINGDSDLADAVGVQGVTVRLYEDDGDGVLGAADTLVNTKTTAADGGYSFDVDVGTNYFVTVDSKTITPNAGFESGFDQDDVWAVQTYGSDTAFVADGAGGTEQRTSSGGYGGRRATTSDDATSATGSEHVASASLGDSVDFAFSFNVVTNTLAGDNADHDADNPRSVQGSLRQFIQNANAISGENVMRFVPVEAPNQSDGGDDWWRINVTELLPQVEDTFTTIDGRAYSFVDGTSARNTVTSVVGNIGTVGLGDDAIAGSGDETTLDGVEGSELELVGDLSTPLDYGLNTIANDTTFRNLSLHGFEDLIEAGTDTQESDRLRIENMIIGAGPTATAASIAANQPASTQMGVRVRNADDGVITNSVIVNTNHEGINLDDAQDWTVTGNIVQNNALDAGFQDGIRFDGTTTRVLIEHNHVANNAGGGIDFNRTDGDNIVRDNTITGNGFSGSQSFGVRVFGDNSELTQNRIHGNAGVGIEVGGEASLLGFGTPASLQNTISRNSFANNGGLAIDLAAGQTTRPAGIDERDGYDDNDGNRGIDFPDVGMVEFDHVTNLFTADVTIAGTPKLEVYRAAANDPSDENGATGEFHGEGQTYLATFEFDGTEYVVTHLSGQQLDLGDQLTVLAIDSDGNTSEFSANVGVQFANLPSLNISNDIHTLPEDTDLTSRLKIADLGIDGSTATSTLELQGTNASFFEIDGGALYLKSGTLLNFEAKTDYSVDIRLTDSRFTGHEEVTNFALEITDVNEPPSVSLSNRLTSLSEAADTNTATKVADINVNDDALGTANLSLGGDDAGLFEISGAELFLKSGVSLDFESNPSLDVEVIVRDLSLDPTTSQLDTLSISLQNENDPPSIGLQNTVTSINEDADVSSRRKVADIVVTDDTLGTAELSLDGPEQGFFEIIGTELFLRSGVSLDHETQDQLTVNVEVRDPALSPTTAERVQLQVSVADINEPPTVSLQNPVTGLAENTDTTSRTKVADIIITDDTLGTNSLSLAGSDASLFSIDGNELFLNAGVSLDITANPSLDVVVQVRDLSLPAATQSTASLSIAITDVNGAPTVALANQTVSLAEDLDTSAAVKVADIVVSDDALGTNDLSSRGPTLDSSQSLAMSFFFEQESRSTTKPIQILT